MKKQLIQADGDVATNVSDPVAEYIQKQPIEVQPFLLEIRKTLQVTLPNAHEVITYQMPTFRERKNIIHFAAFKHHLGIYPGPAAIVHFAPQLVNYQTSKGAIRIPYLQPLPLKLITKLARYARKQQGK